MQGVSQVTDELKPGDIVQYRSGGPKMTVTSVGTILGVLRAWCTWSEGGETQNTVFPVESLERVDSIMTQIKAALSRLRRRKHV
jgi:uncharacterized protein YodC (DUF2158 family)